MGTKFSIGRVEFDLSPGTKPKGASPDPETPFCLGLVGDFSGRANRGLLEPIGLRRPWLIDCDNFEQVMSRLEIALKLSDPHITGGAVELRFRSLDDFHPDKLVQQIKPL